jgi:probable HAF family extracellular repeat protein/beta propeller repeat protein
MNIGRGNLKIRTFLTAWCLVVCLAGALGSQPVWAEGLATTEHRITASAAFETTPTLGNDGNTDLVVYTLRPMSNSMPGAGDIWYQPLANGAPSGMPVQVTTDSTDDQLNDVSGDYIVYTAYDSVLSYSGSIMVYQISTGARHEIGRADTIQEPRIHGSTVVWSEGGVFATKVMLYKLAWLDTETPAVQIAGPDPPTFDIQIGSRFAVWSEYSAGQYDICAYDLTTGETKYVRGTTASIHERAPATSGAWVVWHEISVGDTSTRICAKNLDTQETITVTDANAMNLNPSIDGDLIIWESDVAGNTDIWAYRLSTGQTFQVTTEPNDQYLNDVFGNTVAYVDMRRGTEDVYVAQLSFVPMSDLGTWGVDPHSMAFDINLFGQIVGGSGSNTARMDHALLWNGKLPPDCLGALGDFEFSEARGLNDRGQVVGECRNYAGLRRGFLWFIDDYDNKVILGSWEGEGAWSSANAINNLGQIVGGGGNDPGEEHAVLWVNDTMQPLNELGNSSSANDINDNAQIVGWSTIGGGGMPHAVLWTDGTITDLHEDYLKAVHPNAIYSYATAINDAGQVVGFYYTSEAYGVGSFLYADGKMRLLQTACDRVTYADDINNSGQIVGCRGGYVAGDYAQPVICLWKEGVMEMQILSHLESGRSGWAYGINDKGGVVGWSTTGDPGDCHAVLWGVPLPPESKSGAVRELREIVALMVDMDFVKEREVQSLGAKLDGVDKQIGPELDGQMLATKILDEDKKSNLKAACNLLQAFINEVNAMYRSGRLPQIYADALIEQAELTINTINPESAVF